ncbi:MAG: acyl-CoA reductase [Salibacteraceae bacterium]
MNKNSFISAFVALRQWLREECSREDLGSLGPVVEQAKINNGWFDRREVLYALNYWAEKLTETHLKNLLEDLTPTPTPKRIGLILAGNIPMVGFHDVLCTLLAGHRAVVKYSTNDSVIIPALLNKLSEWNPAVNDRIEIFTRNHPFDAIIATGSNNTARYFEAYFRDIPKIVRSNRTAIAILSGDESDDELHGLMHDCFRYFGLGCRSVTKLYLPNNYDLNKIFSASVPFGYAMENVKYANNYTYQKALMLLERATFLDNDLLLMREHKQLYSPVSVLNYEYYSSEGELQEIIESKRNEIQCIISKKHQPFGSAQNPPLNEYADGINTLHFLRNL